MEWIYITITGLSIIASILAWVAKLKWSSEYLEAKKAQILSIQEQLIVLKERNETLKELSSEKIMSLYKNTKEGLELLNNQILDEKEKLQQKVNELEIEIERLKEDNMVSNKLPDFSKLKNISFQIEKTLSSLNNNYTNKYNEFSKSLDKWINFDLVVENDENLFFIETKKKSKKE